MQCYVLWPELTIATSRLLFITLQVVKFDFNSAVDYQAFSADYSVFITFAYIFVVIAIYFDYFWKFGDTVRSDYHNKDRISTFTILARYRGERYLST